MDFKKGVAATLPELSEWTLPCFPGGLYFKGIDNKIIGFVRIQ